MSVKEDNTSNQIKFVNFLNIHKHIQGDKKNGRPSGKGGAASHPNLIVNFIRDNIIKMDRLRIK
jgi:hypothetical protein